MKEPPKSLSEIPPLITFDYPMLLKEWAFLEGKNIQIWIDYEEGKVFAIEFSEVGTAEKKTILATFDTKSFWKMLKQTRDGITHL